LAINFVADAVNRTLDLKEIADNALHAIQEAMKPDALAVYLWEEQEQALRIFAWRGIPDELAREVELVRRGDDPNVDEVLAGATKELAAQPEPSGSLRASVQRAGFVTGVLTPIRVQGSVVGMLGLGSRSSRVFAEDDIELIEVITNQIGNAMVYAQLLGDLEHKNKLLQLLVEEAHHRIKNNLQMMSGLLLLQAESAKSEPCATILRAANTRLQAIAQVHNLLSQEMPEKVQASMLINSIIRTLVSTAVNSGEPPKVLFDLEPVWLSAEQAVAVALVVNELATNSLLHGRPPQGRPLEIRVQCRQEHDHARLIVSDNGGGLARAGSIGEGPGQGMNIVRQLVQVNLRGALDIAERNGGVCAEVRFEITGAHAAAGQ
jgi:two-component sensor histidine kinase